MKAIVLKKYGPVDELQLLEVTRPTPKEQEVLVKIHATAVNDYDWSMVRGKPLIYRLLFGVWKPKSPIPGMEMSGTVEAVGSNVDALQVGDEVFGDISQYGFGTFAEYICINQKALLLKPAFMSFEEATSIPHAAALAHQGLVDHGKIDQGMNILINGAGGGVGTFGLQLAKMYEAEVTGVDTGDKLDKMRSLGFDHIIDYKKEDFTKSGELYDLILDAKTTRSPFSYLRVLTSSGAYVTVGGFLGRLLQLLMLKPFISIFSKKKLHMVALKSNKDMDHINALFEEGKLKTIIDGPYSLEKAPQAIQRFGEGSHAGKVVISILSMV